ncbi:MAG: hypothetical protein KatS3mg068_1753 [Candidatus Sericytochromatia bacterium]|nr:MAG: hypothetical protein KatS3mg068_1753 [Candidatus Sericytochromatia bacterium]
MRIKVEHSVYRVKKYKIMSEKLKITDINLYNRITLKNCFNSKIYKNEMYYMWL